MEVFLLAFIKEKCLGQMEAILNAVRCFFLSLSKNGGMEKRLYPGINGSNFLCFDPWIGWRDEKMLPIKKIYDTYFMKLQSLTIV